MDDRRFAYTTRDEIAFIGRLTADTFRRYRHALTLRARWGDIDKRAVFRHVEQLATGRKGGK